MKEGLKTLKVTKIERSHLAEGIKPIITCVGSFKDYGLETPIEKPGQKSGTLNTKEVAKKLGLTSLKNVDQHEGAYHRRKEDALSAGYDTYIISPIDSSNKFSENFHRCIGIVMLGVDKETGEKVSCLGHFDPLKIEKSEMSDHLEQRFMEMKVKCKDNTVDAVLVGGRYYSDYEMDFHQMEQNYNDSVKFFGSEVEDMFGFKPVVINGPKVGRGQDCVFVDTKNGRVYLLRPEVNQTTGDFPYDEVDKKDKALREDMKK